MAPAEVLSLVVDDDAHSMENIAVEDGQLSTGSLVRGGPECRVLPSQFDWLGGLM